MLTKRQQCFAFLSLCFTVLLLLLLFFFFFFSSCFSFIFFLFFAILKSCFKGRLHAVTGELAGLLSREAGWEEDSIGKGRKGL